ncbi:MAG: DNA primase [Pseudomonadota bacterium]
MPGGRIPDSFIQDLIARTDIVQLINSRVPLKKSGREYSACCPFHVENTPSFTVSPTKQFYHCFGCGAHGTAIGFLMEYEGLEFVDAVEELASLAGVDVPREGGGRGPYRPAVSEDLYAILAETESWYRAALKHDADAIAYLKDRGLSGEIAARFRLGFAPGGWRNLTDALGTSDARRDLLEKGGLVTRKDGGGCYDKFRGRIIFPIHDGRGRPVAFGGRVFGDFEGPKYLNSQETELFHKGQQLYGLYEARQETGRPDRLIVVEGYMDVLALAQHGVPEAVATLGTATTPEHARLLFRSASEVIFCFDGDRAGRQAAGRAMESVLPELSAGRQARFLFLPDGEDPDTLVRAEGSEAFRDRVARATPFSEFFFARYQAETDMNSLDGRAALVSATRPLIERMPEGPLQEMMFERLGELARTRVVGTGDRPAQQPRTAPRARPDDSQRPSLVRQAVQALVNAPGAAGQVPLPERIGTLTLPGIELLTELHAWCQDNADAVTAQLLARFSEHSHARYLVRLVESDMLQEPAAHAAAFTGACQRLKTMADNLERRRKLEEDLRSAGLGKAVAPREATPPEPGSPPPGTPRPDELGEPIDFDPDTPRASGPPEPWDPDDPGPDVPDEPDPEPA